MERAELEKKVFSFVMAPQISIVLNTTLGLGIPEHLASPKTIAELAEITATIPSKLERSLLTLEAFGFYSLNPETNQWSNSKTTELFLDKSFSDFCYYLDDPLQYEIFSKFPDALKEDRPPVNIRHGHSLFEHFKENPQELSVFQNAMKGLTKVNGVNLYSSIDMTGVSRVLDIGGGDGTLLIELLKHYGPQFSGTVYELDEVCPIASINIANNNLSDSIDVKIGSFFESIPEGYDCITMKHILHDWDDDKCKLILGNCRRALQPGGQLRIIDQVLIRDEPSYQFVRWLDMVMFTTATGKERTKEEFELLLNETGFRFDKLVNTSRIFVIEATAI